MRIALAQLNAVVGDLEGNVERIVAAVREAQRRGGRPRRASRARRHRLPARGSASPSGLRARGARGRRRDRARVHRKPSRSSACPAFDRDLANAAFVCADGDGARRLPQALPPELRRLRRAPLLRGRSRARCCSSSGDVLVGPTICEDVWQPGPPATDLALAGATLLVNLSASPFHVGKAEDREEMLVTRARDNASYVAFCNLVGGQDELVFDGHSVVLDDEGEVVARAPGLRGGAARRRRRSDRGGRPAAARRAPPRARAGTRGTCSAATSRSRSRRRGRSRRAGRAGRGAVRAGARADASRARLGLRDYVAKNGFRDVVIGISGGIDSALTAAIATDALGADRVHTVSMPSRFSSEGTRDDAREVSENLGVDFREIPIEDVVGRVPRRRSAGSRGSPRRTSRHGSEGRC